jgi:polar amino acid transport system substrate-binding protein
LIEQTPFLQPGATSRRKLLRYLGLGLTAGMGAQLAVPPVSLSAEWEIIQRRGILRVAVKDNLRPLGFRDSSGQLQGLEIELAQQLAAELLGQANALKLLPVANSDRIPALLEGRVDLVIARLTATPSRARLADFSEPYYLDGTAILTRSDAIQRLADLNRQTIAVLNGSSTIAVIRSHLPTVQLLGVDSYSAAGATLESGRAIAFAADASVLTGWIQELPEYRLLPTLLSGEALAIAMPRGIQYSDLRQRITQSIRRWKQTGWLLQRVQHWGLPTSR